MVCEPVSKPASFWSSFKSTTRYGRDRRLALIVLIISALAVAVCAATRNGSLDHVRFRFDGIRNGIADTARPALFAFARKGYERDGYERLIRTHRQIRNPVRRRTEIGMQAITTDECEDRVGVGPQHRAGVFRRHPEGAPEQRRGAGRRLHGM